MLVGLFRWIHLASGHRCILGLVSKQNQANSSTGFNPIHPKRFSGKVLLLDLGQYLTTVFANVVLSFALAHFLVSVTLNYLWVPCVLHAKFNQAT